MNYSLFLDDVRFPQEVANLPKEENWIIARSYSQFVDTINKNGIPKILSLDYDLNDYWENESAIIPIDIGKTGKDCLIYLLVYLDNNEKDYPKFIVHSTNPKGQMELNRILKTL